MERTKFYGRQPMVRTKFYHRTPMVRTKFPKKTNRLRKIRSLIQKTLMLILFLPFTFQSISPGNNCFFILKASPICPYEDIWKAICIVETNADSTRYNPLEDAVGIAQIRDIKLREFNEGTGKNYRLEQMYSIEKSREVFMYHTTLFQSEVDIIKRWNGSGPKTDEYYKKVQAILKR